MLTKEMMETAANKLNEEMNHEVRETVDTQLRETIPQMIVDGSPNDGMEVVVEEVASQTIELVSSGAIVPRELLSSFYQGLGNLLPAIYGVNSYFSFIYGGGNLTSDMTYLSIIIGSLLLIAVGGQIIFH